MPGPPPTEPHPAAASPNPPASRPGSPFADQGRHFDHAPMAHSRYQREPRDGDQPVSQEPPENSTHSYRPHTGGQRNTATHPACIPTGLSAETPAVPPSAPKHLPR